MNKLSKIRFKDDNGNAYPDWEVKKLGEITVCYDNKRKPLNSNERILIKGDVPYYGANGIVDFINNYIFNEDLVLLAEDGGNFSEFANKPIAQYIKGKSWVNNHAHVIRGIDNKLYTNFLFYSLVHKDITNFINGTSRSKLNKSDMMNIKISLPCLEEQTKIADFLSLVDERIAKLEELVKLKELYKKGIIQKIFSQKLRFKDDNGNDYPDWEIKKLGEIGEFKSGIGFEEKEQGGNIGVPFYKVSDMNLSSNDIYMKFSNNYVSKEQIIKNKYKPINNLSIIFAKVGAAIFLERKRIANNFLIDNNMMAFIPNANIYYIKNLLDTIKLSNYAQTGALPAYNAKDLKYIQISLPCLEEQTKIAEFLSAIDKDIDLHKQKLEQTKLYKKALLQQLLV